ncbi:12907_t:CDS:2 [Funneliformis caledonium]|uniref:12907_t:CDS:1 n=1 Tax=Funneliformis caledonium TaxID=1117310 RepID=A0A9N9IQR6_9GLOM|nr:12907_t:CDS:2 [Funneliformis caledonium]
MRKISLKLPKVPKTKISRKRKTLGVKGVEMSISPSETNSVSGSYFVYGYLYSLLYSNFLYTSEESALEKEFTKNLSLKDSSDPKDEKQNTASETKSKAFVDMEFTSNPVTNNEVAEGDLRMFAERLGINKFTENKEDWKKFYVFSGSDFAWPDTMKVGECRKVFDYIIRPEWEPIGEELARNTIEYRRLLGSGDLDERQGSHILLINGKLVEYGKEISSEEDEELGKKFPGCLYVPVVERFVELHRSLARDDQRRKEWQSHICIRNILNARDEVRMANMEQGFRMVIDTGATMTVIPYFVRQQLYNPKDGWKRGSIYPAGYGNGAKVTQVSRDWLVCLGDGTNWSNWVRTSELYSWQSDPPNFNCGLIGYDVLNDIPHYKPYRQTYVFLKNDIFNQIPQVLGSE